MPPADVVPTPTSPSDSSNSVTICGTGSTCSRLVFICIIPAILLAICIPAVLAKGWTMRRHYRRRMEQIDHAIYSSSGSSLSVSSSSSSSSLTSSLSSAQSIISDETDVYMDPSESFSHHELYLEQPVLPQRTASEHVRSTNHNMPMLLSLPSMTSINCDFSDMPALGLGLEEISPVIVHVPDELNQMDSFALIYNQIVATHSPIIPYLEQKPLPPRPYEIPTQIPSTLKEEKKLPGAVTVYHAPLPLADESCPVQEREVSVRHEKESKGEVSDTRADTERVDPPSNRTSIGETSISGYSSEAKTMIDFSSSTDSESTLESRLASKLDEFPEVPTAIVFPSGVISFAYGSVPVPKSVSISVPFGASEITFGTLAGLSERAQISSSSSEIIGMFSCISDKPSKSGDLWDDEDERRFSYGTEVATKSSMNLIPVVSSTSLVVNTGELWDSDDEQPWTFGQLSSMITLSILSMGNSRMFYQFVSSSTTLNIPETDTGRIEELEESEDGFDTHSINPSPRDEEFFWERYPFQGKEQRLASSSYYNMQGSPMTFVNKTPNLSCYFPHDNYYDDKEIDMDIEPGYTYTSYIFSISFYI